MFPKVSFYKDHVYNNFPSHLQEEALELLKPKYKPTICVSGKLAEQDKPIFKDIFVVDDDHYKHQDRGDYQDSYRQTNITSTSNNHNRRGKANAGDYSGVHILSQSSTRSEGGSSQNTRSDYAMTRILRSEIHVADIAVSEISIWNSELILHRENPSRSVGDRGKQIASVIQYPPKKVVAKPLPSGMRYQVRDMNYLGFDHNNDNKAQKRMQEESYIISNSPRSKYAKKNGASSSYGKAKNPQKTHDTC